MSKTPVTPEVQAQLRRFWGITFFSLGIFWGVANLIYIPVVVLTTIKGGSIIDVVLIVCGGLLLFIAPIRAFSRRRAASIVLLVGGLLLFAVAFVLPYIPAARTSGVDNRILAFSPAVAALLLGGFGMVTNARGWPALREPAAQRTV